MVSRNELAFSLITFSCNFAVFVSFLSLHPILPTMLRHIYQNESNTDETETDDLVQQSLGIVNGCGAVMQLAAGLVSGWLPFGLTQGYILGAILCLIFPIIVLIHQSFVILCIANALVSLGLGMTITLTLCICSRTIRKESLRIRIITTSVGISSSVAAVISYASSGIIHQFYGRNTLFFVILTLALIDLSLRIVLYKLIPRMKVKAEVRHDKPTKRKWTDRLRVLKDPYIIILAYFRLYHGIVRSSMFTTAPNWILTHIQAEQWQTGVIMGLSSGVEILSLLLATITVTSNRRRFYVIITMVTAESCGLISYPFVNNTWTLLVPEIIIRAAHALGQNLLSTQVAYIIDQRSLRDHSLGFSVYSALFSIGLIIGTFTSGAVVSLVTFKWFYIAMGSLVMASVPLVLAFRKVRPIRLTIDVEGGTEKSEEGKSLNSEELDTPS